MIEAFRRRFVACSLVLISLVGEPVKSLGYSLFSLLFGMASMVHHCRCLRLFVVAAFVVVALCSLIHPPTQNGSGKNTLASFFVCVDHFVVPVSLTLARALNEKQKMLLHVV